MKKLLTVIAFILLTPIYAVGFIIAIPTRAFVEAFKLCWNFMDSGRI